MKKRLIILVVLIIIVTALLNAESKNPIIDIMTWEDGYHDVYLLAGTYSFGYTANVITHIPYDETNIWGWSGEIVGVDSDFYYGTAYGACTNQTFNGGSSQFSVYTSGTYSIRGGAYAIWAVTLNSNEAKLHRHQLFQNQ